MHDAGGEAHGLEHLAGGLDEFLLLGLGEEGGRAGPRLVEPGLQRWEVVSDLGIGDGAVAEDDVHIDLVPIEVPVRVENEHFNAKEGKVDPTTEPVSFTCANFPSLGRFSRLLPGLLTSFTEHRERERKGMR